jgi:hypothetical protein
MYSCFAQRCCIHTSLDSLQTTSSSTGSNCISVPTNLGPIAATHTCCAAPLQEDQFCDEFHLVDLRLFDNCKKVCEGCDHVFNLAADMGGMGFIQSNHSVILYNNTMISYNMLEAARQNGVSR